MPKLWLLRPRRKLFNRSVPFASSSKSRTSGMARTCRDMWLDLQLAELPDQPAPPCVQVVAVVVMQGNYSRRSRESGLLRWSWEQFQGWQDTPGFHRRARCHLLDLADVKELASYSGRTTLVSSFAKFINDYQAAIRDFFQTKRDLLQVIHESALDLWEC